MKKLLYIILFATSLFHTSLFSQWVQQTVPVTKPITGIKFINANTGWACTSIGTGGLNYCYILNTTNGGTNWLVQDSTFDANNYALSVVDANIAYVGGFNTSATANLHKTTNGGANWILIPTPTNMHILDMQFLNKDSGWTVGGFIGPDVRTTTNGGLNWIVRTNGISVQTQRIFFLNYNTGFCGADGIYKTTNAGLNWVSVGTFLQSPESIFFLDLNTGWVGTSLNRIYNTTNGGANWVQQAVYPNGTAIVSDIWFANDITGYAGTGNDKIYKTTNSGTNWGYQIDTGASYRISFINDQTGWTGSLGARISKTTNGGGIIIYTGINNISTEIPDQYMLYQNYPNPFNPVTNIKYQISNNNSEVLLSVFDVTGRHITDLVKQVQNAGTYISDFDASKYSSGIYFYKLTVTNGKEIYSETRKMMLIK